MRISACFPTLSNLSSANLKKNETFGYIEGFLQKFFNEVPRSSPFSEKLCTVFRQGSEQNFMKEFSCKQKKKIQYNHSSLEMHYFAVFTKKGQDLSLLCCCKAWIA